MWCIKVPTRKKGTYVSSYTAKDKYYVKNIYYILYNIISYQSDDNVLKMKILLYISFSYILIK
jgi:hypothetical protein